LISVTIREITAEDTYSIRQPVLRPGRPLSECMFAGDDSPDTFHLGAYKNDELIGVASFMKNSSPFFKDAIQFQLRGMAVQEKFKGLGIGSKLLIHGEERLIAAFSTCKLWFNARDYAVDFYKKFNYTTIGEKFDVPGVCKHIVMHKNL
jgi:predicted GNAT family N-acyltransferase